MGLACVQCFKALDMTHVRSHISFRATEQKSYLFVVYEIPNSIFDNWC